MKFFSRTIRDTGKKHLLFRGGSGWTLLSVTVTNGSGSGATSPEITLEDQRNSGFPLGGTISRTRPCPAFLVPPHADVYGLIAVAGATFSIAATEVPSLAMSPTGSS